MKTIEYAWNLPCENKDKFNYAKENNTGGIILDYRENTLDKIAARNYYVMQSNHTGVVIPAIALKLKQGEALFNEEMNDEMDALVADFVDIAEKMKVTKVIVWYEGDDKAIGDKDTDYIVRILKHAMILGEKHKVMIEFDCTLGQAWVEKIGQLIGDTA